MNKTRQRQSIYRAWVVATALHDVIGIVGEAKLWAVVEMLGQVYVDYYKQDLLGFTWDTESGFLLLTLKHEAQAREALSTWRQTVDWAKRNLKD